MGYLLWTLLNFSVAALLLYFMYRLTKFAYLKFGALGAIVTVLILLSISTWSNHRNNIKSQTWDFKTTSNIQYFPQDYEVSLMKNSIFDIELHMISLSDKDRQAQEPLKAFSTISGLIGYNDWTPENIFVNTKQDSFDYTVAGRLEWKLLNFTVYTERKTYAGSIKKT